MRQIANGSDIRKRIMQTALSMFGEMRASEVTVRRIAERTGIGHATIYSYFTNKEELLFSLMEAKLDEMTSELREHLQGLVGTTDKLRKFSWSVLRFYERNPEFALLLYMVMPIQHWLGSVMCGAAREQTQMLTEIVQEGQAAGEFRDGISLSRFRDLYFGGVQRLVTVWLASGRQYQLASLTQDFTDLIISALRPQPPEGEAFKCPFLEAQQRLGESQQTA